jgi:hypothetical protein
MNTLSLKTCWQFFKKLLQQKVVQQILSVFIILSSGVFIAYAIISNWNELRTQRWEIDFRYILLAISLYPVGMLPTAAAWHKLVQAFGIRESFRTNLRIYSLSSLPRHIPGFVWFVTSRTLLYQEQGIPTAVTIAATGVETGLLALTGFIIAISLLLFEMDSFSGFSAIRIVSPLAVFFLILLVASTPKLNKLLYTFLSRKNIEKIPQLNQMDLVWSLVWMFVAWSGGGLLLFILSRAIVPVQWSLLPALIGMWGIAGAVSLSIGVGIQGLGIREVTLGALLSTVFPPVVAIVLAIAFRLALTIGEFLWVVILVWATRKPSIRGTVA